MLAKMTELYQHRLNHSHRHHLAFLAVVILVIPSTGVSREQSKTRMTVDDAATRCVELEQIKIADDLPLRCIVLGTSGLASTPLF